MPYDIQYCVILFKHQTSEVMLNLILSPENHIVVHKVEEVHFLNVEQQSYLETMMDFA